MVPTPPLDSLNEPNKDALIQALLARVEELCARVAALETENAALRRENAELRAKLNLPKKTPGNSSTPPSRGQKPSASGDDKDASASGKQRKPHQGAHRPLHPNPTKRRDITDCVCPHCGADVSQSPQFVCEAYDHIEIPPIKPEVTRVALQGGTCSGCGKKFKAAPPADMQRGSPFGENLRALVLYLRFTQNIALERLSALLSTMLGLEISEGALVNILHAAREPFAAQREAIRARLMSGTTVQSDETGLRVGKANWYLWVFHHQDNAVFVAEPTRAQSVVSDFLGDFRPDYWVSDRYAGQMGWAQKEHQVCLAHLIRDVQYAIDCGDAVIGPDLRRLLAKACDMGARRAKLADATLKSYKAQLQSRLTKIVARTPLHQAGEKLLAMIKRTRQYLFAFMTNRELPATNNGSEQAIRPCVIFRKVTYCFRSEWGAKLYADIRSVIETARRRGIDALAAIRLTLAGKPLVASAPS
jgi:transposase